MNTRAISFWHANACDAGVYHMTARDDKHHLPQLAGIAWAVRAMKPCYPLHSMALPACHPFMIGKSYATVARFRKPPG